MQAGKTDEKNTDETENRGNNKTASALKNQENMLYLKEYPDMIRKTVGGTGRDGDLAECADRTQKGVTGGV